MEIYFKYYKNFIYYDKPIDFYNRSKIIKIINEKKLAETTYKYIDGTITPMPKYKITGIYSYLIIYKHSQLAYTPIYTLPNKFKEFKEIKNFKGVNWENKMSCFKSANLVYNIMIYKFII